MPPIKICSFGMHPAQGICFAILKKFLIKRNSNYSLPVKIIKTNFEGLLEFKFYDSKLIAYRGRPNNFLTVRNFITNQVSELI